MVPIKIQRRNGAVPLIETTELSEREKVAFRATHRHPEDVKGIRLHHRLSLVRAPGRRRSTLN
jgi:hypothetical protein